MGQLGKVLPRENTSTRRPELDSTCSFFLLEFFNYVHMNKSLQYTSLSVRVLKFSLIVQLECSNHLPGN